MAFVDDDEVKKLKWNLAVIDDRHRLFGLHHLRRVDLLHGFIQLLVLQQRVHTLDGADADLAVLGNEGGFQPLHVVQLRKFTVVVTRHVGHKFLLGLFTEIPGVHQEQDPFGVSVLQQTIDRCDGGVCLAGPGRHLDEGPRAVVPQRLFEPFNRCDLARPEA